MKINTLEDYLAGGMANLLLLFIKILANPFKLKPHENVLTLRIS